MRLARLTQGFAVALAFALGAHAHAQAQYATVGFSPGNAIDLVLETIQGARREIDMAAYEFTSSKIADALVAAHERGVNVRVMADAQENRGKGYSKIYTLVRHGIAVRLNSRYAVQHNKFCVVDGAAVETGSFNYTRAAETKNAENVVVIRDRKLAGEYHTEFERLWKESEPAR